MIQHSLVFLAGASSALVVSLAVRRWRTRWTALVINAALSFLLGGFAAAGQLFSPTATVLGYAALGTVTSLAFVVRDRVPAPTDVPSAVRLATGVFRLIGLHAVVCTAFGMAGFLLADVGAILIYKLF
jgi:hypothetical protein